MPTRFAILGCLVPAVVGGMPAPRESLRTCQQLHARAGDGAPLFFPRTPLPAILKNFPVDLFVAYALQCIGDAR